MEYAQQSSLKTMISCEAERSLKTRSVALLTYIKYCNLFQIDNAALVKDSFCQNIFVTAKELRER